MSKEEIPSKGIEERIGPEHPGAPRVSSRESGRSTIWGRIVDRRLLAPALITVIIVGGHLSFGILEGYDKILLAIGICVSTELILGRIFLNRWPHLAGAYISGNSVGILLRSTLYWPFAICSALTITSKYVLRFRGRHLWNPSNFGVSAMFFLAPYAVAPLSIQWGNTIWPMVVIWCVGAITLIRLKRIHICVAYAIGFLVFAGVRAWLAGDLLLIELAPITGPMYQLFILFMITDPKTTVKSRNGQIGVALLVALVEMIFRLGEVIYAPFYALFIVGPIALISESYLEEYRQQQSERQGIAAKPA